MTAEPQQVGPLIGHVVLGRYRLVRELARGGMGAIYLARSEGAASFVKPVVVKRMLPEFVGGSDAARMFKREARIMSTLRHPGIVSVFDFGREDAGYMLVMDYVHGFHLGRWAGWVQQTRGEVPTAVAVHVVVQVLDALQYAHTLEGPDGEALHIVHRDISPSNVLLDVSGHVRLADFGIAQSEADAPDVKTTTRTVKGKFSYLAPEILEGAAPTPSTDVYSAAVVLHEILMGRNEFRTSSPTSTVARVLSVTPTRLDQVRKDVSRELADVVAQALEKSPEKRFASAADLAKALRRVRGVEAEDANQMLAEVFGRDFRDPSLPRMFALPELDELERAWRGPSPVAISDPPAPAPSSTRPAVPEVLRSERRSDEPTTGSAPVELDVPTGDPWEKEIPPPSRTPSSPQPVAASDRRRAPWGFVGAGIAAAVAAGIAIAGWIAARSAEAAPEVVYVEATPFGIETGTGTGGQGEAGTQSGAGGQGEAGTQSGAGGQSGAGTQSGAGPETGAGASQQSGGRPRSRRSEAQTPERREAAAIQQTFARHTAGIRSCFAAAPPGSPAELVLRFSIDQHGTVQRVELSPAGIAATAQEQCVMRLAQATDFPDVPEPRSFRIPIEVRAR